MEKLQREHKDFLCSPHPVSPILRSYIDLVQLSQVRNQR